MHTHHAWVLLEKFLGFDFLVIGKTRVVTRLHPSFIAMVQAQPFLDQDNENPCHHLHEFEEMCSCLSISGMTQETLKWKLFPFSLIEGKAMVDTCRRRHERKRGRT
jgi:hypothetical protein